MDEKKLPLVSIITPSYNQGKFIQETIDSVLAQRYQNLEYIVVDGGSTDDTLKILQYYRKCDSRFRYISGPDFGQGDAINKGIRMANGEIIGWLNSDDTYLPGAITKVVDLFLKYPNYALIYGRGYHIDEKSEIINSYPVKPYKKLEDFFDFNIICQPASFFRKEIFQAVGGIDESLYFTLDYDLWIKIAKKYPIGFIDDYLANTRLHSEAKTIADVLDRGLPEILNISNKHFGTIANKWLYHFLTCHAEAGAVFYLNLFKEFNVFGISPKIVKTNHYQDLWSGPNLLMNLKVDSKNPLHVLLIKGENVIFEHLDLHVYLNNNLINNYRITGKSFILEIPVFSKDSSIVKVKCGQRLIPCKRGINSDSRALSFIASEIIPLSSIEYKFYKEFQKGPKKVCKWLHANRKEIFTPKVSKVSSDIIENEVKEAESKIILSLHIPKTAGSTLNNILDTQFTLEEKINYYGGDYDSFVNNLNSIIQNKKNLKCINGHFRFGIHEQLKNPFSYITMLRQPVDRVISTYYYIRRVPAHNLYEIVKNMSLEDFVTSKDEGINYLVYNMQTTFVSGKNPPNLEEAKKNLEQFFDVVGITEMFDKSLFLMKKTFGWNISDYESVNVTQNRPILKEHSEDVIELIKQQNQLDLELYKFGKHLFNKKLESLDDITKIEMNKFLCGKMINKTPLQND